MSRNDRPPTGKKVGNCREISPGNGYNAMNYHKLSVIKFLTEKVGNVGRSPGLRLRPAPWPLSYPKPPHISPPALWRLPGGCKKIVEKICRAGKHPQGGEAQAPPAPWLSRRWREAASNQH